MIEPILLAVTRVATFEAQQAKTNATGFFFKRGQRLFVVTSRHVLIDEPTRHFPDRIEIELHVNPDNVAESIGFSIPLYRDGKSVWRDGLDGGDGIDVALIELDRTALLSGIVYRAFTPAHLYRPRDLIEAGTPVLIVGFPLGFHDTLHHLPVVRQAVISSSFGMRFQGHGYFLTDARMDRGTSGAPVVMRMPRTDASTRTLPWMLLGTHSARLNVGSRDFELDEALGLNSA
ncbi:S1 family peptidase [Cupriavidus oxalaticus]|jgi:hypothetical protein|uniref:S1 family peptidase n=1 Tax=Cupriavidus oxalaticus TaxID=96344 RepID=UPI004033EA07